MEYNIPEEHFSTVLTEIAALIEEKNFRVHFPLECRWVAPDDIWLSPANGRKSAYIAAHMYKGMPHEAYFAALEAVFQKYGGRPHWGKMHTQNAASLAKLYPHWEDFQRVRRELDPKGVFLNGYLKGLFGA
jgi:FAD/FMN-containing dehydrogenase